jgi:hypothetical protein
MARNMHPNSLANLKNIKDQPNAHHGRYPTIANSIKAIPEDAQKKVYAVLWTAISMPNVKEASKYISKEADNLPECGFVLQVALRELQGKNGFRALMDILDRLFGKPKSNAEVSLNGSVQGLTVMVKNPDTAEKLEKIIK